MDKNFVKAVVNETVERLLEGGPGSGRYPKGSKGNSSDSAQKKNDAEWTKHAAETGQNAQFNRVDKDGARIGPPKPRPRTAAWDAASRAAKEHDNAPAWSDADRATKAQKYIDMNTKQYPGNKLLNNPILKSIEIRQKAAEELGITPHGDTLQRLRNLKEPTAHEKAMLSAHEFLHQHPQEKTAVEIYTKEYKKHRRAEGWEPTKDEVKTQVGHYQRKIREDFDQYHGQVDDALAKKFDAEVENRANKEPRSSPERETRKQKRQRVLSGKSNDPDDPLDNFLKKPWAD